MRKKLQVLNGLLILLLAFEFIGIIKEKKTIQKQIIQKTFSIGLSVDPPVCNARLFCSFNFSNQVLSPSPTLGISENDIIKNVKADENYPINNDFCLTVPVLTYHRIQPWTVAVEKKQSAGTVDNHVFEQQMSYLISNDYHTITAYDLVNALINKSSLPEKSVVITLDDGYESVYSYAFSIAKKYQLKLNLMISTGLVGNQDFLSWDQINEMKNSGLVYFTSHTWSHFALGQGSVEKIQFEIKTSKKQLEQHIGQTVNIFTYPYGSFNATAIKILREDGFIGGFSTIPGKVQCKSYIMTLHRISIGNAPLSAYGL